MLQRKFYLNLFQCGETFQKCDIDPFIIYVLKLSEIFFLCRNIMFAPVAKPARQFGHAMLIFSCSKAVKTVYVFFPLF